MNRVSAQSVTELEHIRQSIEDILTTPVGSRVMRREYGSLLFQLVDQPSSGAISLQLSAAAVVAIMRWEPRVRLHRAQVVSTEYSGQVGIELDIELKDSGLQHNLSIPLHMGAL